MQPNACGRGAIRRKCGGFRAADAQGGRGSSVISLTRDQRRLPRSLGSKGCRSLTSVFEAEGSLVYKNGGCVGRMRMDGRESESLTGKLGKSREQALLHRSLPYQSQWKVDLILEGAKP